MYFQINPITGVPLPPLGVAKLKTDKKPRVRSATPAKKKPSAK